jgi:hypothetical protein
MKIRLLTPCVTLGVTAWSALAASGRKVEQSQSTNSSSGSSGGYESGRVY